MSISASGRKTAGRVMKANARSASARRSASAPRSAAAGSAADSAAALPDAVGAVPVDELLGSGVGRWARSDVAVTGAGWNGWRVVTRTSKRGLTLLAAIGTLGGKMDGRDLVAVWLLIAGIALLATVGWSVFGYVGGAGVLGLALVSLGVALGRAP